jgi:hypothetical protein
MQHFLTASPLLVLCVGILSYPTFSNRQQTKAKLVDWKMESLQVHLRFIVGKLTHGVDERRNSEANLGSR